MNKCCKVKKLLSRYIDKEADMADTDFVKSHLENCLSCRNVFVEMAKVKNLIVDMPRRVLPQEYLVERINSKIFNDKFAQDSISWLERIGDLAKKLIPVPVSVMLLALFFLILNPVEQLIKVNVEDNIISGSQVTTDTVLSLILEGQS
jgi:hypothetical protein